MPSGASSHDSPFPAGLAAGLRGLFDALTDPERLRRTASHAARHGALYPNSESALWDLINRRRASLTAAARASLDPEPIAAHWRRVALERWGDDPEIAEIDVDSWARECADNLANGVRASAEAAARDLTLLDAAERARGERGPPPYKIVALEVEPCLAVARDRVREYVVKPEIHTGVFAWIALALVAREPVDPDDLPALVADARKVAAERGGGPAKIAAAVVARLSGVSASTIERLRARKT